MTDAPLKPREAFILAEYCGGPFYWGWWLYDRDTNNGQMNQARPGEGAGWGWLKDASSSSRQNDVYELCRRIYEDPPKVARYKDQFAEWFATTFPCGLEVLSVESEWETAYLLQAIPTQRPRQRRGVIRTIRGAAMCDRKTAKLEESTP